MKKLFSLFIVLSLMVLLPMGANATEIKPNCDKSCPTEDGKCQQTCRLEIVGNKTALTSFDVDITIDENADKIKLLSINGNDGWEATQNRSGNKITMLFTNPSPVTAADFTLGTFVMELADSSVNCSLTINGVEVTTETTTQVKTGATLPIAIIGCGLAAVAVIYLSTRHKKMYKI